MDDTSVKKKKPKKKSMTAVIKDLRERNHIQSERFDSLYHQWRIAKDDYNLIIKYIPIGYYRIKFKIKCRDGNPHPFEEIHNGVCAQHAIESCKEGKLYPLSFELVNIELLAK